MSRQAPDWGFAPRPAAPGPDLAALWQRARLAAENAPACPCHGIVAGRIDADTLEDNMLTALRTRYRLAGHGELVALIEARLRKSPFAGLRHSFAEWLRGLDAAPLDATMRDALRSDLAALLTYYAEAEPAFACS